MVPLSGCFTAQRAIAMTVLIAVSTNVPAKTERYTLSIIRRATRGLPEGDMFPKTCFCRSCLRSDLPVAREQNDAGRHLSCSSNR